jgi:hypothetical protein
MKEEAWQTAAREPDLPAIVHKPWQAENRLPGTVPPPSSLPRNWGAPFSTLPESLMSLSSTFMLTCLVLEAPIQCLFFWRKFAIYYKEIEKKLDFFKGVNLTIFAIFWSNFSKILTPTKWKKKKNIAAILHSHFLTHIMLLKLLLFFNHFFLSFSPWNHLNSQVFKLQNKLLIPKFRALRGFM